MEHLALEIFDLEGTGSRYAALPEDTSITITDTSEVFASGDVWSHSFILNTNANAHILGSAGELHGSRLHDLLNKRRARLWVEGVALYTGYLKLDDDAEVDKDGNIDVTFESGHKTFDELIEGGKANQVPMMDNIRFGLALWTKRWVGYGFKITAAAKFDDGKTSDSGVLEHTIDRMVPGDDDRKKTVFVTDGEEEGNAVQEYPHMVFPTGTFRNMLTQELEEIDCINTDYPFDDGHPYCNVPLCYQAYGYKKKNEKGDEYYDYSGEPEAQRGYEYMPANRVNSAPNFFVIYWIRALMKHLGIYIEENQMMDVQDLRRLFFVNTKCAYKQPKVIRNSPDGGGYGKYRFSSARLIPEQMNTQKQLIKTENCGFVGNGTIGEPEYDKGSWRPIEMPVIEGLTINVVEVADQPTEVTNLYRDKNSFLHDAIATSDCFPDVEISEVIKAIESGFGVRFLFSDSYQRVRIVLLKNIFLSQDIQEIVCDIISDSKIENPIRGFRMTYGESEDTQFYYKGFADKLPHKKILWPDESDKHDYSHWDLNAVYGNIINKVSAFDKTCFVTPDNGNAYVIKIDKDAKRYDELHPSLFEGAGFMDAEDGDCRGEDNTIKEVSVGFKPAIMNDLNMEAERSGESVQRFALFVDDTMRPRRISYDDRDYNDPERYYDIDALYEAAREQGKWMSGDGVVKPGEFAITSDVYARKSGLSTVLKKKLYGFNVIKWEYETQEVRWPVTDITIDGHINEGYRLYLQDNYEPNDEGVPPMENHDWGLTLGIMRGSGSDAYVKYEADPNDEEGNDTWEIQPGSNVTSHPDTCDCYGREWDYDGSIYVENTEAADKMLELWPDSNIDLIYSSPGVKRNDNTYISGAVVRRVEDYYGETVSLLFATEIGVNSQRTYTGVELDDYVKRFRGVPRNQMYNADAGMLGILVEVGASEGRVYTLLELQQRAFLSAITSQIPMILDDNGIGSRYGRFSLKLRAQKPNPYYNPGLPESDSNRQYLKVTNENLRDRGLCDMFYKEYSYWVRNARIAKRQVHMELAQLQTIDKTKKVKVGDVTGFIRKMQYSVNLKTGLGLVTLEIMYI